MIFVGAFFGALIFQWDTFTSQLYVVNLRGLNEHADRSIVAQNRETHAANLDSRHRRSVKGVRDPGASLT